MKSQINQLEKARDYAFLLLKFRPRSEKEIYQRLKKKKFEEEIIKETISFLKEKDFINDAVFTQSWIDYRLKKDLGPRKIREELRLKGINNELINKGLKELTKSYSQEETVKDLAERRFLRLKNIDAQTAKRRVYAFLLRRGFSGDVIIDTINKLCKLKS